MKKQWRRLLFAAFISSTVFAGTWIWYQSMASKNTSHGNEKPLAYVGKVVDDIQRRPASRLLWQLVNSGEPLYNGEALRTSEHGEVRVQFVDSDRYLDLEPESLIVIKKSEGEIALDLMEGSLFVNAAAAKKDADKDAPATPSFVLNSANGQVDLSTASASLSKGQGDSVDVQVLEGKASVKTKDGQNRELTSGSSGAVGDGGLKFDKNSLKIISPSPQKPVAMNADDMQPLPFQWTGFPADSQVSLMLGETRKDLKEIGKTQKAGENQLQALVPIGKHYWKLVAKNNTGAIVGESAIYRTEVVARYASAMVFPEANADVPATKFPYDMNFKWQNAEDVRAVTLEVWSDASLKKKISTMNFESEESATLPALPAGTYFWRVTSYYENTDKAIIGKIQHFTLKEAPKEVLQKALESKAVQVSFTMPEKDHEQFYTTAEPHLNMTWDADKAQNVSTWRVTLESENGESSMSKQITVKTNHVDTPVAKPGRYIASIEALDQDGQVLGKTSSTLNVSPSPLLPASDFLPATGPLKAHEDGKIQLEWGKVEGAKEYQLSIQRGGKELKKLTYKVTSTSLKNLLPGEYDLQISAVDASNRPGQPGPLRKLVVPEQSNVRAPAMKKIQVN